MINVLSESLVIASASRIVTLAELASPITGLLLESSSVKYTSPSVVGTRFACAAGLITFSDSPFAN